MIEKLCMEEPQSFAPLEDESETHLFILIIFIEICLCSYFFYQLHSVYWFLDLKVDYTFIVPYPEPGYQICFEIREFGDFRSLE